MNLIFALLIVTLIAGISDILTGKIRNWLSYTVGVGAFVFHTTQGIIPSVICLSSMIVVLMIMYPIFSKGWLKGGDVKMIVACCGLVSFPVLISFLLYTMFAGGILAIFVAWRYGTLHQTIKSVSSVTHPLMYGVVPTELPFTTRKIPYGVAIFFGAVITIVSANVIHSLPSLRIA